MSTKPAKGFYNIQTDDSLYYMKVEALYVVHMQRMDPVVFSSFPLIIFYRTWYLEWSLHPDIWGKAIKQ